MFWSHWPRNQVGHRSLPHLLQFQSSYHILIPSLVADPLSPTTKCISIPQCQVPKHRNTFYLGSQWPHWQDLKSIPHPLQYSMNQTGKQKSNNGSQHKVRYTKSNTKESRNSLELIAFLSFSTCRSSSVQAILAFKDTIVIPFVI